MIINEVVEILIKYAGTDKIDFISGEINDVGTDKCKLSGGKGSVYGIAIKLEDSEVESFLKGFKKDEINKVDSKNWKSIGDDFYPLYWGKDENMGSRLYAHTKVHSGTGTLQLNKIENLKDKKIIYGAIPCLNSAQIEQLLKENYPDILKTRKG